MDWKNEPALKISISQIDIFGFMGIETAKRLKFCEHNNLVDGSAMAFKIDIIKAIDFILNPSFAETGVALNCLNPRTDSEQAYVKLHLTGTIPFYLNNKQQTNFAVTRFINQPRIDNIYHGAKGHLIKQPLRSFHDELRELDFIRIDDLVIGHFFAPNSFALNRLYCQSLNLNELVRHNQTHDHQHNLYASLVDDFEGIFQRIDDVIDNTAQWLHNIRVYQYGINEHELNDLIATHGDMNGLPQEYDEINQHACEMKLSAGKEWKLRQRSLRIDVFKLTIAAHIKKMEKQGAVDYLNDYTPVRELFGRMMDELPTYVDNIQLRSQREVASFEYGEMQLMCRRLKYHADDLPKFIGDCESRLNVLRKNKRNIYDGSMRETNEKFKQRRVQVNEQTHAYMDKIDKHVKIIDNLAKSFNEVKLKVFTLERQLVHIHNQSDVYRFGIDVFSSRHNTFFTETEMYSLHIGYRVLWSNSKLAQHFRGQIGDFIHANADENLLRLSLPYLIKLHFATFLFRTKSAVELFLTKAKEMAAHDQCAIEIKAMSFEDLSPMTNAQMLPYTSLADEIVHNRSNDRPTMDFIRRFFQRYRWASNSNIQRQTIEKRAKRRKVHIFHANECYDEHGLSHVIYNGKGTAVLVKFIAEWQKLADNRDGVCVRLVQEEAQLNQQLNIQRTMAIKYEKDLWQKRIEIRRWFDQILLNINVLIKCEDAINDYFVKSMKNEALIRIWSKKKEFLEANNLEPINNMAPPMRIPVVTFVKIVKLAEQLAMASEMLKMIPMPNLEAFHRLTNYDDNQTDYDIEPPVQQFTENDKLALQERRRQWQRSAFYAYKILTLRKKQNELHNPDDPIDDGDLEFIRPLSADELKNRKKQNIQMIPANMFIFDPIKHNRKCVALLENDSECCSEFTVVQDVFQHNPTDSYVRKIHRMYFALHCETLQRMNDRQFLTRIDINPERLTFNVKLRSIKHDLIIGPNTPYEPEWVNKFPLNDLCEPTTEFTFWYHDIQEDARLPADAFEPMQQQNVYALAFHMLLAAKTNTSLILLNNTIQARPTDEVKSCIGLNLMLARGNGELDDGRSKQIILVDHNDDGGDEPAFDGQFKRIRCTLNANGRMTITDSFH